MRSFWLIIITAASLACIAPAAEKVANLSGVWTLDAAQSQLWNTSLSPRKIKITTGNEYPESRGENNSDAFLIELPEARMENLTLLITHTDDELQTIRKFTIEGEEKAVVQKFLLDGSQCINVASNGQGEFVSRTNWKKNKLINSGTQTLAMGFQRTEIPVEEEYSISKDGKKLTIKTTSFTSQGVAHLRQVFKKGRESKP